MNDKLKAKLVIGQATIWMACMVTVVVGLTVLENLHDEVRYGPACTVCSVTVMLFWPIANAHMQSTLKRWSSPADQAAK